MSDRLPVVFDCFTGSGLTLPLLWVGCFSWPAVVESEFFCATLFGAPLLPGLLVHVHVHMHRMKEGNVSVVSFGMCARR